MRALGSESVYWHDLSLDWRVRIRYELYTIPRDQTMVVGNVLAGPGLCGVDCRAARDGWPAGSAFGGDSSRGAGLECRVCAAVWRVVGSGRADVRAGDSLSRHCVGICDCAWSVHRFRNVDSANLRWVDPRDCARGVGADYSRGGFAVFDCGGGEWACGAVEGEGGYGRGSGGGWRS